MAYNLINSRPFPAPTEALANLTQVIKTTNDQDQNLDKKDDSEKKL